MARIFWGMSGESGVGRKTKCRAPCWGLLRDVWVAKNTLSSGDLFIWAVAGGPGLMLSDFLLSE